MIIGGFGLMGKELSWLWSGILGFVVAMTVIACRRWAIERQKERGLSI